MFEDGGLAGLDDAGGHGADVEEEIAIAADGLDEDADAVGGGLEGVVGFPGPGGAEGHAGLPGAGVLEGADDLLGGVVVGGEAAAVVDHDVGLKLADHFKELAGVVFFFAVKEAVEKDHVDAAVVGAEFAELAEEVGAVGVEVFADEIGVVPVGLGVIKTKGEAGLAGGLGELFDHVAFEGGAHDVVVGEGRIEHAEAAVVLRGEHDVFHAGVLGDLDKGAGVELGGVKGAVEVVVNRVGDVALAGDVHAGLFVPADLDAEQAGGVPVHEEAEGEVVPALHRLGAGLQPRHGGFVHRGLGGGDRRGGGGGRQGARNGQGSGQGHEKGAHGA